MSEKRQTLTLAFPITKERILLGMKKRGFGAGRFNGFGGKIQKGENVRDAAVRELTEECGIVASTDQLESVGVIIFHLEGARLEVHNFLVHTWQGEPVETEEMRPEWFLFANVPYKNMWIDDKYWLPHVLGGKRVNGEVWFGDSDEEIVAMNWDVS